MFLGELPTGAHPLLPAFQPHLRPCEGAMAPPPMRLLLPQLSGQLAFLQGSPPKAPQPGQAGANPLPYPQSMRVTPLVFVAATDAMILRSVRLHVNICLHQETMGSLGAEIKFFSPVSVPGTEERLKNYSLNECPCWR